MKEHLPWWVDTVVILAALLFGAGGVIALISPEMLVSPHVDLNSAARVYAGYMVSRNLALSVMLVVTWVSGARQALMHVLVLAALVQLFDAGFDAAEGRVVVAFGVVVLGTLFSLAAARLSGHILAKGAR